MRDAQQLRDVVDLIPKLDEIEKEVDHASAPIAFRGCGNDQCFCFAWRLAMLTSGATSAGLTGPYSVPSATTTVAGARQANRTGAVAQ